MTVRRAYAAVSFGQMHYRYAGTPGKPVVVLLHQTPSTSEMYEDLMIALAADYRLIAPDTPGMGMSDAVGGELSIAAIAAGIAEFLDEIGVDRCNLFGHHTGASIAAEVAVIGTQHIDAVALSGPTLLSDDLRERLPETASGIAAQNDGSHLLQMWQRIRSKDESAPLQIIERETLNGIRLGDLYPATYDAVLRQDFAKALRELRCPVLVFAGTDDPLYGQLDAALRLLGNGHKESVADAKTFVCETHCPEVAGLVRDFFSQEAA